MALKCGLRFRTILLLGVRVSVTSDPLIVGYLLELLQEVTLPGPTMLIPQASMARFQ
jgi:hypothetical protein